MRKKLFLILTTVLLSGVQALAADEKSWLDDTFFQDGKYKVVIVILGIIFLGIMIFVSMLDRRVSKLEKQHREGQIEEKNS